MAAAQVGQAAESVPSVAGTVCVGVHGWHCSWGFMLACKGQACMAGGGITVCSTAHSVPPAGELRCLLWAARQAPQSQAGRFGLTWQCELAVASLVVAAPSQGEQRLQVAAVDVLQVRAAGWQGGLWGG